MNTCVIEALYPEVCNLFGDTGNLRYLKLCLPQATFIETAHLIRYRIILAL